MDDYFTPKSILLLKCSKCHFVTQRIGKYLSHIIDKHKESIYVSLYSCPVCMQLSSDKDYLSEHITTDHEDIENVDINNLVNIGINVKPNEPASVENQPGFICPICSQKFGDKSKILEHVYKNHRLPSYKKVSVALQCRLGDVSHNKSCCADNHKSNAGNKPLTPIVIKDEPEDPDIEMVDVRMPTKSNTDLLAAGKREEKSSQVQSESIILHPTASQPPQPSIQTGNPTNQSSIPSIAPVVSSVTTIPPAPPYFQNNVIPNTGMFAVQNPTLNRGMQNPLLTIPNPVNQSRIVTPNPVVLRPAIQSFQSISTAPGNNQVLRVFRSPQIGPPNNSLMSIASPYNQLSTQSHSLTQFPQLITSSQNSSPQVPSYSVSTPSPTQIVCSVTSNPSAPPQTVPSSTGTKSLVVPPGNKLIYTCNDCMSYFSSEEEFRRHNERLHQLNTNVVSQNTSNKPAESKNNRSKNQTYVVYDPQVTKTNQPLQRVDPNTLNNIMREGEVNPNEPENAQGIWRCSQCRSHFVSWNDCQKHCISHSQGNDKPPDSLQDEPPPNNSNSDLNSTTHQSKNSPPKTGISKINPEKPYSTGNDKDKSDKQSISTVFNKNLMSTIEQVLKSYVPTDVVSLSSDEDDAPLCQIVKSKMNADKNAIKPNETQSTMQKAKPKKPKPRMTIKYPLLQPKIPNKLSVSPSKSNLINGNATNSGLCQHIKVSDKDSVIKCNQCSRFFSKENMLKEHIAQCHRKRSIENNHTINHESKRKKKSIPNKNSANNGLKDLGFNQCHICWKYFSNSYMFLDHMSECHSTKSTAFLASKHFRLPVGITWNKSGILKNGENPPDCPFCPDLRFGNWELYTNHARSHSMKPEFLLHLRLHTSDVQ